MLKKHTVRHQWSSSWQYADKGIPNDANVRGYVSDTYTRKGTNINKTWPGMGRSHETEVTLMLNRSHCHGNGRLNAAAELNRTLPGFRVGGKFTRLSCVL